MQLQSKMKCAIHSLRLHGEPQDTEVQCLRRSSVHLFVYANSLSLGHKTLIYSSSSIDFDFMKVALFSYSIPTQKMYIYIYISFTWMEA